MSANIRKPEHVADISAFSASNNQQRRLGVRLLTIQLIICLGYFVFVGFFSTPFTHYFLPTLLTSTGIAIFLWLQKRIQSAIIFDLVALNIMLFFLSEELSTTSGVELYYIAVGAAALVLFGYENWKAGVGFAILSFTFFLVSHLYEFESLPVRNFNQRQNEIIFAVNSIATSIISIYCVFIVMKLNYESQKRIQKIITTVEEQNEELIKANEELDRFVYSASHDLKSPLISIKGLVNTFEIDPDGKREEYLPKLKNRIQAMEKFINEITDYSRNTRVQVSIENILLSDLVNEVVRVLQYTPNTDRVNFRLEIPGDTVIRSDVYRLKIILNNIISNAIKYCDLNKEQPYVNIKAFKAKENFIIEIIDNGIGIKDDNQDKVFNMFYRATDRSSGSGLGLYIMKESVKKLRGTVELNSQIGVGSTFTVILPQEKLSI